MIASLNPRNAIVALVSAGLLSSALFVDDRKIFVLTLFTRIVIFRVWPRQASISSWAYGG